MLLVCKSLNALVSEYIKEMEYKVSRVLRSANMGKLVDFKAKHGASAFSSYAARN